MDWRIEFNAEISLDEWKEETLTYFQSQGFKLKHQEGNSLQFVRGSIWRNMVTFNPLRWISVTKIVYNKKVITAEFDVDTIYQWVSRTEANLWNEFILNYRKTIVTGNPLVAQNFHKLKETRKAAWKDIGYPIFFAFLFTIPALMMAIITEMDFFIAIGTTAGLYYGYHLRSM